MRQMCRDCGIVTANVNEVDLDLFFTKAKYKGTRKLDYNQFQTALGFIAQKEGVPVEKASRGSTPRRGAPTPVSGFQGF